jgi:hypothetical protein
MRKFSVADVTALNPAVSEDGEQDIAGLVTTALAVTVTDAGEEAEVDAAVTAISDAFGTSVGLKVFIDEDSVPTKKQVIAALNAVIEQVKSSNRYA